MSSMFGTFLRVSLFGQSHGDAIGIILDGFPAGGGRRDSLPSSPGEQEEFSPARSIRVSSLLYGL